MLTPYVELPVFSWGSKDSPSPSIEPAPVGREITPGLIPDLSGGNCAPPAMGPTKIKQMDNNLREDAKNDSILPLEIEYPTVEIKRKKEIRQPIGLCLSNCKLPYLSFMRHILAISTASILLLVRIVGAEPTRSSATIPGILASHAINRFGIELLRQATGSDPGTNLVLSPYSIQASLAMAYAGASGDTHSEMARVLHFGDDELALHGSFKALADSLARGASQSQGNLSFHAANQLFGHSGYRFEKTFLGTMARFHGAPLEPLDFSRPGPATRHINDWVETQTHRRIQNLLPPGILSAESRLVLVNALHLKGAWQRQFNSYLTRPEPFHRDRSSSVAVPMMRATAPFGHRQFDGFQVVSLSYRSTELQMLLLVPDKLNGLPELRSALTTELLAECRHLPSIEVDLALPKLRLSPTSLLLAKYLRSLGLRSALDQSGSADFSRMARTSQSEAPLAISEVIHKTFLEVSEEGTEAAAATAVVMPTEASPVRKSQGTVVRVDSPFLFAIQHRTSGACLFIGEIWDPR
jgi:serpin B